MKDIVYPYIEEKVSQDLVISLEDIKSYLKLSQFNDFVDADLSLMCNTALEYAEKYTRRLFSPTNVTTKRCFWGEFRNGQYNSIFTLRRSPLIEITSIVYDNDKILNTENYKILQTQDFSQIYLTGSLPTLEEDWFPIEIKFKAGFETLPNDIKLGMLQHIASMWLNRGDCDNDTYNKLPKISKDIYRKYKIIEVGV